MAEGEESRGAGPTLNVTHAASHVILAKTMINPEITEINRMGYMIPFHRGSEYWGTVREISTGYCFMDRKWAQKVAQS